MPDTGLRPLSIRISTAVEHVFAVCKQRRGFFLRLNTTKRVHNRGPWNIRWAIDVVDRQVQAQVSVEFGLKRGAACAKPL